MSLFRVVHRNMGGLVWGAWVLWRKCLSLSQQWGTVQIFQERFGLRTPFPFGRPFTTLYPSSASCRRTGEDSLKSRSQDLESCNSCPCGRLWGLEMVTACLHPHNGDTPRILLHGAVTSVSGFLSCAEDDCRLQAGSQRLLIETEMRSEHK